VALACLLESFASVTVTVLFPADVRVYVTVFPVVGLTLPRPELETLHV
jgi:hypothetical protein